MISFNFTGDISDVSAGLQVAAKARGFEINDQGVLVEVCKSSTGFTELKRTENAYRISYAKKTDFFRACARLCGMLEENEFYEYSERAAFDSCGIMLDCSRNAVASPETVYDFIGKMACMGLDRLMLYTEDTYEIKEYPYFGYMRGRYTAEELKQFDETARSVGVLLVPCIQTLAHLSMTLRWGYGADMSDTEDILLIDEEKTYDFIDAAFKSLRESTTSEYIHIGMDEAHYIGLGRYLDIHGNEESRFDILLRHLERVCKIAQKYNFKPMMWSDMFFRLGSKTRNYYDMNVEIPEWVNSKIPENLSLVYWDYYHAKEEEYTAMIKGHSQLGCDIVFAGGIWTWCGMGPQYRWTNESTVAALASCRKNNIRDVFATVWGDDGGEVNYYTILPGMQLYAEYNYSDNPVDVEKRFKECTGKDYSAFMTLESDDFPNKYFDGDIVSVSKQLLFQDPLCGLFEKNFEKVSLAEFYADKLEKISKIQPPFKMKKLFDYYKKLYFVLSKKAEICSGIRKLYMSGDNNTLSIRAKKMRELAVAVKELYRSYRILWLSTNKVFGLDRGDLRFGGLITRFEIAASRIEDYVDGRISKIDELEEEPLIYTNRGEIPTEDKPLMRETVYQRISSVSSQW